MLDAENLGGVLLTAQHNFSWLSAGGTNGVDVSRDQGNGALLVRRDGRRFVLANRIEMPRLLAEEIFSGEFEPIEFAWEEERSSSFLHTHAVALLEEGTTLGSDLPLNSEARTIERAISGCRYELTENEIERYRELGSDAAEIIGNLMKTVQPGETEKEIARRAANDLAARDIRAVVSLAAGDERIQRFRHPVPTDRVWEEVLMVVVCARRHGLIASLSRFVCAGAVPDELRRRTLATARVGAQLFAATQPGTSGRDLYRVAAQSYAAEGFPGEEHLHHQGGACGYRTRDWVAHPLSDERVKDNQAFAWNPSITGAKVEETSIVSPDGIETITMSPDWPSLSIKVAGRDYLFPDVLSRS
ncbi:MAG: peptidase [Acidobacteria bacterium]|nr:peptidase [Acidobacteriota bacterium]